MKLEEYEIIRACGDFPYDDFAIGRIKETHELVVIYAYDGGYDYVSWSINDLLDVDEEKMYQQFIDAIGKYITSIRPYKDKFPFPK